MSWKIDQLGPPDMQFSLLTVWVHGRQFPEATDYWDGNWLRVTASCSSPGSQVVVTGPIIHLGEIAGLLETSSKLHATLQGEAHLRCIEANLRMGLKGNKLGHIAVHIEITPDHLTERHVFEDTVDQSYLPNLISTCERILERYPIREPRARTDGDA